jgi:hypothetical protein
MIVNASVTPVEQLRDGFLGELTDAALETALRHGVGGPSVDQELDLWHVLNEPLRRRVPCPDGTSRAETRREDFLAELADAAYQETLRHGFRDSFLDVRLDLWEALRRVFWEGRFAGAYLRAACGETAGRCRAARGADA